MDNYNNNQLGFIDLLSMASFCIGLMNLDENLTQSDIQNLQKEVDEKTKTLLNEIHSHLQIQDDKLDNILSRLEKIEK